MDKKPDWNELEDIKTAIGQTPPLLFEILGRIAGENSEQGSYARESRPEILKCIKVCKKALGEIRASAGNFTLHDLQHSINVIDFMGQLVEDPSELSAIEIVCLIYTALLHDVGMIRLGNEKDKPLEKIRNSHGDRSAYFIENDLICDEAGQPLNFGRYHLILKQYLPTICASHMKDISFIDRLPKDLHVDGMRLNTALCAVLLRLADAMDLSRNRAPYTLYHFLMLKGISQEHWKKHLSITDCFIDDKGFYRVDGICDDEVVHRAVFNHLDMIEKELRDSIDWMSRSDSDIELSVKSDIVKREIWTEGNYHIWHHTFTMDFAAISDLFMGEHLYGDRQVGLREIIQNAIDACMVRKECEQNNPNPFETYIPCITVSTDDDYVYIRDNGIGMTDEVIQKYFLNIGVSYYRSKEYRDLELSYKPMGFFGIGFLSGFMLSDEIWVRTSGFKDKVEYQLHLVKGDKYIAKYEFDQKRFSGTEIKLKKDRFYVFDSFATVIDLETDLVLDGIKRYISENFWKLKLVYDGKSNLKFTIIEQNYEEYLEGEKRQSDYQIILSRYLNGIEGSIYFKENDSYRQLWKQSGVQYDSIFEALDEDKIEIGGELKKSVPFAEKGIGYNKDGWVDIKDVDQIPDDYIWILIPKYIHPETRRNLNYKLAMTDEIQSEIEASLYKNSWQSVFISREVLLLLNHCLDLKIQYYNISFDLLYFVDNPDNMEFYDILEAMFGNPIEYLLVKKFVGNINPYESTFSFEKTVLHDVELWLKSVRISSPALEFEWFMFEEYRYFVNIKNDQMSPQASRQRLTDGSNREIVEALRIVKYLWFIEQLESRKCSEVSINYLKKKLRKIWNKDNSLLKSEIREKFL